MALTFWQRMRVAFRGWSRRREEEEQRRREEFLKKNTWGAPTGGRAIVPDRTGRIAGPPPKQIDIEGLQVAYLDDSGQIAYYLDTTTGDVHEVRDGQQPDATRYKRVPARTAESDVADRKAFVETLDDPAMKAMLASSGDFRRVLSTNRTVERAWYNFRNAQATRAIESWLRTLGLR